MDTTLPMNSRRASAFSSATPGISPTAAATGASMRCLEVTYAFSDQRARVSSVPRSDSVYWFPSAIFDWGCRAILTSGFMTCAFLGSPTEL